MKYNFVGIFKEGLAAFENRHFQWGYPDRSGKEVVPARLASPKFFINGLARMETGNFFTELKITYIERTAGLAREIVRSNYQQGRR